MPSTFEGIRAGAPVEADGTPFGKNNWKVRPSRTNAPKFAVELESVTPGIGWAGDATLTVWNYGNLRQGDGTLGDLILEASGFIPLVGDAIDGTCAFIDFFDLTAREGFGVDLFDILYADPGE